MIKKILITGGSGFIGRSLTEDLLKNGRVKIGCISRSCPNIEGVTWLKVGAHLENDIIEFKPDCVIHLATCFNNDDVESLLDCNVELPIRILIALSKLPVKNRKIIFAGSYWQNGDYRKPHVAIDIYSASKKALRPFIDHYSEYQQMSAIELILFGTYGKNDRRRKILDLLMDSIGSEQTLELSPGEQLLNLVHIEDVCGAFQVALRRIFSSKMVINQKYSVASKDELSVIELIAEIEKVSGKRTNTLLGVKSYRNIEVFKPVYNEPLLPEWLPKHSLLEYLSHTLK